MSNEASIYRPCPCGEIPPNLDVYPSREGGNEIVPGCCGEWRLIWIPGMSNEPDTAIGKWNSAPRAATDHDGHDSND